MLSAADPVSGPLRRILIAGVSGVGKTTYARRLAAALDLEHVEIDGLFHGPNWTRRPEFLDDVKAFALKDSWVTEWQYASARELLVERADLMVWLDYPFRVTLYRVVRRTVRRRLTRQRLWNGNVEAPLWTFFTDDEHIVRWAIRNRRKYHRRIPSVAAGGLPVVWLRSQQEADAWLHQLARGAGGGQ